MFIDARFNGLTLLAYLNYTPRTPYRSTESTLIIGGPGVFFSVAIV